MEKYNKAKFESKSNYIESPFMKVSNADQVLALIRRERKRARVFALGNNKEISEL